MADKPDSKLVAISKPGSLESECFKILRSRLLFPASGKKPRSLLVTSAVPGEGKSFIAANLAVTIAQGINDYVLLVDCDLRRPRLHEIFSLNGVQGLSEHLSHGIPLSNLLYNTGIDKLSLVPGGATPDKPSEILTSLQMKSLIQEVVDRYDDRTVIIDSPPPTLVAETSVLAKRVEGVLVVIEYGKTPRKLIDETIELVGRNKVIGCILNRTPINISRYGGSSHYKKYLSHYGIK